MLHILLLILKIIGIILAVLIGMILLALICALFVPIRYRIKADGKLGEEEPLHGQIKVTWLLHIINVIFSYPRTPYLKARIFCFTIFDSSKSRKKAKKEDAEEKSIEKENIEKKVVDKETIDKETIDKETINKETINKETIDKKNLEKESAEIENINIDGENSDKERVNGEEKNEDAKPLRKKEKKLIFTVVYFFKRIFEALKNIEYTIKRIYDRIKKIIENIQYYTDLIQSGIFKSAFAVSKKQLFRILRAIRPERCRVNLLAGTGDPASTGQILAVYGMMYPFIGNNVVIQADFENKVVEGDIYIKGKITVITFLLVAFRLYTDKNIRKLLKMLKREDA